MSAEDRAKSEIIIAKQRNGPTGTIQMHFDSRFTRFDGVDTHHQAE
jgi:replicative DNA helicase